MLPPLVSVLVIAPCNITPTKRYAGCATLVTSATRSPDLKLNVRTWQHSNAAGWRSNDESNGKHRSRAARRPTAPRRPPAGAWTSCRCFRPRRGCPRPDERVDVRCSAGRTTRTPQGLLPACSARGAPIRQSGSSTGRVRPSQVQRYGERPWPALTPPGGPSGDLCVAHVTPSPAGEYHTVSPLRSRPHAAQRPSSGIHPISRFIHSAK